MDVTALNTATLRHRVVDQCEHVVQKLKLTESAVDDLLSGADVDVQVLTEVSMQRMMRRLKRSSDAWQSTAREVAATLQQIVGAFPAEANDESEAFAAVLQHALDSTRVDQSTMLGAPRGADKTSAVPSAPAVALIEQRYRDVVREHKEQATELAYCQAKLQRREIVIAYVQGTLHRELNAVHEQLAALTGTQRPQPLEHAELYSLLDFLEVLEREFDPRQQADGSSPQKQRRDRDDGRRRGDPRFTRLSDDELSTDRALERFTDKQELARLRAAAAEREKKTMDMIDGVRKEMRTTQNALQAMSGRHAAEVTRLKNINAKQTAELQHVKNDLGFAAARIQELEGALNGKESEIASVRQALDESAALTNLNQIENMSSEAEAKNAVSAEAAKLALERRRIYGLLEKVLAGGTLTRDDIMDSMNDDDPVMAGFLRGADEVRAKEQEAEQMKEDNETLKVELTEAMMRADELESATEKVIEYFHDLGQNIPSTLRHFFRDDADEGFVATEVEDVLTQRAVNAEAEVDRLATLLLDVSGSLDGTTTVLQAAVKLLDDDATASASMAASINPTTVAQLPADASEYDRANEGRRVVSNKVAGLEQIAKVVKTKLTSDAATIKELRAARTRADRQATDQAARDANALAAQQGQLHEARAELTKLRFELRDRESARAEAEAELSSMKLGSPATSPSAPPPRDTVKSPTASVRLSTEGPLATSGSNEEGDDPSHWGEALVTSMEAPSSIGHPDDAASVAALDMSTTSAGTGSVAGGKRSRRKTTVTAAVPAPPAHAVAVQTDTTRVVDTATQSDVVSNLSVSASPHRRPSTSSAQSEGEGLPQHLGVSIGDIAAQSANDDDNASSPASSFRPGRSAHSASRRGRSASMHSSTATTPAAATHEPGAVQQAATLHALAQIDDLVSMMTSQMADGSNRSATLAQPPTPARVVCGSCGNSMAVAGMAPVRYRTIGVQKGSAAEAEAELQARLRERAKGTDASVHCTILRSYTTRGSGAQTAPLSQLLEECATAAAAAMQPPDEREVRHVRLQVQDGSTAANLTRDALQEHDVRLQAVFDTLPTRVPLLTDSNGSIDANDDLRVLAEMSALGILPPPSEDGIHATDVRHFSSHLWGRKLRAPPSDLQSEKAAQMPLSDAQPVSWSAEVRRDRPASTGLRMMPARRQLSTPPVKSSGRNRPSNPPALRVSALQSQQIQQRPPSGAAAAALRAIVAKSSVQ